MAVRGFPFYLRERDTFCTEFVLIGKKPKKGTLLSLSERVIHLKAESLSNHSNRCSKQKTANQLQNTFFISGGTQLITINWSDWKFLLKNRRAFSFSVGLSTLYVCFGAKWNKQFPTPPPPLLSKSVNPYELVLAEEPYFPGIWDLRISWSSRFFRTGRKDGPIYL